MPKNPLAVGAKIGILGGGQLARMLCLAAAQLGFSCHIYSSESNCPAEQVCAHVTHGSYDDVEKLKAFAQSVDVVTCEFENVKAATLEIVSNDCRVFPSAAAFSICQDRLLEKQFLQSCGLDIAPFLPVSSLSDLEEAVQKIGFESILKTRSMGYDGKGQIALHSGANLQDVWAQLHGVDAVLEQKIQLLGEFSVIGARSLNGDFVAYDLAQNVHKNHILHTTTVPCQLPQALQQKALFAAQKIGQALQYCGVFAVEFFYAKMNGQDAILVNEIAPRVHNSGHWTMDGCACSQFENHIRAIVGWPLGETTRFADVVMTNLLGDEVFEAAKLAQNANCCVHVYGKLEARAGRKMGHFTLLKPLEEKLLDNIEKNA